MGSFIASDIEFVAVFALLHRVGLYKLVPMSPLGYGDKAGSLAEEAGVLHMLQHSIPYEILLVRDVL